MASVLFTKKGTKLTKWDDTKNVLWKKYQEAYSFYLNQNIHVFFSEDYQTKLQKVAEQTQPLFEECVKSNEFGELMRTSTEYKEWLEQEWASKSEKVVNTVEEITKYKFPDDEFTIFVIDPKVGGGKYLGNRKIFWGHKEDWENYSMVYLMHEVLHEYLGNGEIEHAVIELATDNELRIRLNNDGEYFQEGEEKVGHDFLQETEKKLLPHWQEYLKSNTSIFEFIKSKK